MKICNFGDHNPDYPRTRVILMGLTRFGAGFTHVNERTSGWRKYLGLWKKYRTLTEGYDIVVIGFGDSRVLPIFARLLT